MVEKVEKAMSLPNDEKIIFFAKPIIILIICKILVIIVSKILDRVFEKTKLDLGIRIFLTQALKILIYVIGILMASHELGLNTSSLVAVLGVVSLALSLSLQNILTNIFSGVVLLATKPFVVGDFVEISGVTGRVSGITLMRTRINTPDNKVELLPNSDVASGRISNYSNETKRRVDLEVSADYGNSTRQVIDAINEIISADDRIFKEEDSIPLVRLSSFNSDDISYIIKVWCKTEDYWDVYYDLLERVRDKFDEKGIEFSYPHRVIHIEK